MIWNRKSRREKCTLRGDHVGLGTRSTNDLLGRTFGIGAATAGAIWHLWGTVHHREAVEVGEVAEGRQDIVRGVRANLRISVALFHNTDRRTNFSRADNGSDICLWLGRSFCRLVTDKLELPI